MRRCNPCGIEKPLSEFSRDSGECGGYRYYCKACAKVKKDDYLQRKKNQVNQSKFEQAHRGLSAIAKKVFDSVPISEAWNIPAISADMRRLGSGGADSRIVLGCLNTLIEAGIVKEVSKGAFQRIEIREKAEPVVTSKPMEPSQMSIRAIQPVAVQPVTQSATPIDRLSKFAIRLRELANDMETAALELAEQAEKNEIETSKMRQLQQILKSLG